MVSWLFIPFLALYFIHMQSEITSDFPQLIPLPIQRDRSLPLSPLPTRRNNCRNALASPLTIKCAADGSRTPDLAAVRADPWHNPPYAIGTTRLRGIGARQQK
jgi:hypothetical protein